MISPLEEEKLGILQKGEIRETWIQYASDS